MSPSLHYDVVFDVATNGYRVGWFPAFGLIFIALGLLFVFAPRFVQLILPSGLQGKGRRIFSWFFLCFAIFWTLVTSLSTAGQYWSLKYAEETGHFRVIEGPIQNFEPMPYSGHAFEKFQVGGVRFSYSDYVVTSAFNQTSSHGGPIREGLPVRISYVGNAIIRLEILSGAAPSPSQRSNYARDQKSRWEGAAQADPLAKRMQLGLEIAASILTLAWNLNWRHYIRYWRGNRPPYGRYWELGFRIFFMLSFIGAIFQLVRDITMTSRSTSDYWVSLLDSLIWIGCFAATDLFFRWRLRRQNRKTA